MRELPLRRAARLGEGGGSFWGSYSRCAGLYELQRQHAAEYFELQIAREDRLQQAQARQQAWQ